MITGRGFHKVEEFVGIFIRGVTLARRDGGPPVDDKSEHALLGSQRVDHHGHVVPVSIVDDVRGFDGGVHGGCAHDYVGALLTHGRYGVETKLGSAVVSVSRNVQPHASPAPNILNRVALSDASEDRRRTLSAGTFVPTHEHLTSVCDERPLANP